MKCTVNYKANILANHVLKEVHSMQDNVLKVLDPSLFGSEDIENDTLPQQKTNSAPANV